MSVEWEFLRRALRTRSPLVVDEPGLRRAAVALVFREAQRGIELLFIKRAHHPYDPWSGQVGFPGGRVEPSDRDWQAAAVRETAEEVDIDLGAEGEFLGSLDQVRAMARLRPVNLCIAPYAYRITTPAEGRPSREVASLHWLPLSGLMDPDIESTFDYVAEGRTLRFPCLRYDGLVIWGLTFRMFTNLAVLVRSAQASAP
jgi:8-oxo-dGTP pyrophosphatase MutT (NUDIX family)